MEQPRTGCHNATTRHFGKVAAGLDAFAYLASVLPMQDRLLELSTGGTPFNKTGES